MKKILSVMCGLAVASSLFAAKAKGPVTINLWSFTDEVPGMVEKFKATHPELEFNLNTTIIATTNQEYEPALIPALQNGEVDIYAAEAAFIYKYTQGDMSDYATPYKDLGIKIDKAIADANIASYTVDIGKNPKGQVVALGYQATGGCFIYRRSIAKKVFGSDDPKTVQAAIGGGSQSWNKFWDAAAKLADNGVAIVSGDGDIWHAYECSDKGWIVNDKLYIDPKREAFMDASKNLTEKGWSNGTQDWTEAWYADMQGKGAKPVFGFFGPAWLINYVMAGNSGGTKIGEGTYGDWAVCNSPVGFFWGGTWLLASKAAAKNKEKKAIVKEIIEWITLDTSNNGLLYQWANGTYQWKYGKGKDATVNTKDTVSSGTVMSKSDGKLDFLKGQNMFDYFVPAGAYANGKTLTQYDSDINAIWRDQVRAYANGQKSKAAAIKDFKQGVADKFGIDY
ncbi:MAG: carbohydrate ABC transporter substrate-binding protein [Treponema sp.]|nr:carbohydrate ABC transporter substrate-binding protein [Treponema sp.]